MKKKGGPSSVDRWWAKVVPRDSLRPKILARIAEAGPSSAYDIAKSLYATPVKGYSSVFNSLKELEAEKILQRIRSERSLKGGKKKCYAISEFIGVPGAWAYVGPSLDFEKLLQTHRPVFLQSKGLDAYYTMWQVLGAEFCVEIARKSFLAIIQGLEDKRAIFNLLASYIIEEKISEKSKFVLVARKNDLVLDAVRDVRDELTDLIDTVEKWKSSDRK